MEEFLKMLELDDGAIVNYVRERVEELDSQSNMVELIEDEDIQRGWIKTDVTYWPSGYRSDGFCMTEPFFVEFCNEMRRNLKGAEMSGVRGRITQDVLIKLISNYVSIYFGPYDEEKRKRVFNYDGQELPLMRKSLGIDTLKGKNVGRCVEHSAACNGLANFFGIDCSFVLSDVTTAKGTEGHAYCLLYDGKEYKIWDPNFFMKNQNNKVSPYVFSIDPNILRGKVAFPGEQMGDVEYKYIEYDFPWDIFSKVFKLQKGKNGQLDVSEDSEGTRASMLVSGWKHISEMLKGRGKRNPVRGDGKIK